MKIVLIIVLANILAGCATSNYPPVSEFKPTPQERLFATHESSGNEAIVTVLRVAIMPGSLMNYHLLVDGKLAAKIGNGEFADLYVKPGERIIEIRHPHETMGFLGNSVALNAEPNERYFYYLHLNAGQLVLMRTTGESVGMK